MLPCYIICGLVLGISGGFCGRLIANFFKNTPLKKKALIIIITIIIFSIACSFDLMHDINQKATRHCSCEYCTMMRD